MPDDIKLYDEDDEADLIDNDQPVVIKNMVPSPHFKKTLADIENNTRAYKAYIDFCIRTRYKLGYRKGTRPHWIKSHQVWSIALPSVKKGWTLLYTKTSDTLTYDLCGTHDSVYKRLNKRKPKKKPPKTKKKK